jgi:hypothetical protein
MEAMEDSGDGIRFEDVASMIPTVDTESCQVRTHFRRNQDIPITRRTDILQEPCQGKRYMPIRCVEHNKNAAVLDTDKSRIETLEDLVGDLLNQLISVHTMTTPLPKYPVRPPPV